MAMMTELMPHAAVARGARTLRLPEPQEVRFRTDDDVELLLTRYRGGAKGPVIMAPGFGMSTLAYVIDTMETNLTEYLVERGYDVWLLDYRASPALAASHTQFTLDDVALRDYPAAVRTVREIAQVDTVQILGHCVASGTLLMALMSGLQHVRSAICSQFLAYIVSARMNELKAITHSANIIGDIGNHWMSTGFDGSLGERVFNDLLALYPSGEPCDRPVCRRILFMYGEVFKHVQLSSETHDAIPEMFGIGNMKAFEHLSAMIRAGRLVDADGGDVYLPKTKSVTTPIALVQAAENRIFIESGGFHTYEFLKANLPDPELVTMHVVPGYKHLDCFIGESAEWDVFPVLEQELDRFNV
jgi:choline dehydrogenase-like flavoprotein